jgi:hypothetical protein
MSSSVIVSAANHTTLMDMGFFPIGAVADSGICCAYMALPNSRVFVSMRVQIRLLPEV